MDWSWVTNFSAIYGIFEHLSLETGYGALSDKLPVTVTVDV